MVYQLWCPGTQGIIATGQKEEDAEWCGKGVHLIFGGHSKAAKTYK